MFSLTNVTIPQGAGHQALGWVGGGWRLRSSAASVSPFSLSDLQRHGEGLFK